VLEVFMSVADDKRESGTSLMFMGVALWVSDLLVVFFLPAGAKLGVGAVGLLFLVAGYRRRFYAGPED
jgi:hypothetical protein